MTVIISPKPLTVFDSTAIRKHFSDFAIRNVWKKPRRIEDSGPQNMTSARLASRDNDSQETRRNDQYRSGQVRQYRAPRFLF